LDELHIRSPIEKREKKKKKPQMWRKFC
jgi:hypothetical protein